MAQIELGIDVDSRDVVLADASIDRLTEAVRGLERASSDLAAASKRSDSGVRGVANATKQAETRTQAAIVQYQKLHGVWLSLAGVAGGVLVGGLLRTADAYTEITNKLRVVSEEQDNVNALFQQLLGVANETRAPLDAIVQLYQRASLASKELGATQEQMIQFVENVGRALALQGGSAASASGALLQLSQALGGGIVRAEEFNSILEGAFPIAQAAARGLDEAGGSVAKLRTLVIEGKVASDEFFQAILSQTEELEAVFGKTGTTIGQSLTVLRNNVVAVVGAMNESAAVTSTLGAGILALAENLERLLVYAGTAAALFGGKLAVGIALAAARTFTLVGALKALQVALVRTGIGALVIGAGELVFQFLKLVEATGGWGNALTLLGQVAAGVWEGIMSSASAIGPALSATWAQVKVNFFDMVASLANKWQAFLEMLHIPTDTISGFVNSAIDAMAAAQGERDAGLAGAGAKLTAGFEKAAAAVEKLKSAAAETNANLSAGAGSAAAMSNALGGGGATAGGGAAGAARKTADATADIVKSGEKIVDQAREYADLWGRANDSISAALQSLATGRDVLSSLGGGITGFADAMWGEQVKAGFDDLAKQISDSLANALEGLGGRTGLSSTAVAGVGVGLASAAVGVLNRDSGEIGSGIGSAAGSVLGSKFLGFLGAAAGPVGMILGGIAGGFLGKLFGGDEESPWKRVSGQAFTGTTYATSVTTDRTVNTENDEFHGERFAFQGVKVLLANFNEELAQFVEAAGGTVTRGTRVIVDQNAALKSITGALEEGKANRPGETREEAAERISKTVAEIMGLAAAIVQKAGPPLTEAQVLWRETQKRFSETNIEILKDLGFSAQQITGLQKQIQDDIREGFERDILKGLVGSGQASRQEIDLWRRAELDALEERRKQQMQTAREIGASTALVASLIKAERKGIEKEYRDLLGTLEKETRELVTRFERVSFGATVAQELISINDGLKGSVKNVNTWYRLSLAVLEEQRREAVKEARRLGVDVSLVHQLFNGKLVELAKEREERILEWQTRGLDNLIDRLKESLGGLGDWLNNLEQRRSDVLAELTRRVDAARRAEQSLADARAGILGGDLNPGGPMAQFRALQAQFNTAIRGARGGDADAANTAAGLASQLLTAGRSVFGSGGGYVDLFRLVNEQLLGVQKGFGARADQIEKRLDAETFTEITERSTKALLTSLGRLNTSIQKVEDRIEDQTRRLELAERKRAVGRGAA